MANRKFDFPSGSPDRLMYHTGQRGSSLSALLNRSASFREGMENPVMASVPSTSRSNSSIAHGDVSSFFQCLRFDPKVIAADHKSNRQGDYKREINAALGITYDDSPGLMRAKLPLSLSAEEIKRFRTGLRGSAVKARERVKIFNEALSVLNKFFPSIPSKKRSRSGGISSDRSTALLASDQSVPGPAISKMGIQNHGITGSSEFEPETSEERPKNVVANKRTRTSLVDTRMDGRNNPTVKPSVSVERDREMLRVANGGFILGEDRTLSVGFDGWERSKAKKKRSGIKSDISPSSMSSHKLVQGYREAKQGLTQRAVVEARSRSSNESKGGRRQVANGTIGLGKSDGISQQSCLSKRSSIPRTEMDNSLINDSRESSVVSDKERLGLRVINRMSVNDELNSSSPTSTTKINGSVRGSRSSSCAIPKLPPVIHKASPPSEWELSHCTGKPATAGGANNRKRTPVVQSSPSVAHWSGQRPQKISRTARRTNFSPIISNHEEAPSLDSVSDVAGIEISSGFPRHFPASSPQQLKLKGDTLSSLAPSESEDSGAAEIVSKEKPKKSGSIDNKASHNVQKVSHLLLPSRKNKLPVGEDLADSVQRQGRTGRGYASTRALMPMTVQKVGNVGTAKQIRSAKLGFEKAESSLSKAGCHPTRKLSDRKSYVRQKHVTNAAAVLLVDSDDGHADLVAAVNAVISSAHAFSGLFWRHMEPFLGFISDPDIAFLKQQAEDSKLIPMSVLSSAMCKLIDPERDWGHTAKKMSPDFSPQHLVLDDRNDYVVPLYQRLMAALLYEEDTDLANEDSRKDTCGTGFLLDEELGLKSLNHVANSLSAGDTVNGYWSTRMPEHNDPEIHQGYRSTRRMGHVNPQIGILESALDSDDAHSLNATLPDKTLLPGTDSTGFQYETMNINKKLLLEAQSIGIFLDPTPDVFEMEDDRICKDIIKLEEQHHEQVSKKKGFLSKVLKAVSVTREIQEKEFEKHALDALVAQVYKKYLACCGPNATVGKNTSSKMFKQAALAIVKRTLERCHEFEDTGSSCFSKPLFRDMFFSVFSKSTENLVDSESLDPNNSTEARVSASMGPQETASLTPVLGEGGVIAVNFSDLSQSENQLPDSIGKEDASFGRVRKRELLLDDVVGGSFGTSNSHSDTRSPLSSSTKGKRSERDREGKGLDRESLSRNATNKIGRPVSNAKGERKLKTKPKQKTTQLSFSVNGLISKQPKPTVSVSKPIHMTVKNSSKQKNDFSLDVLDDPEVDLQLPGQDIGSWLNIDDDGLQDHDFMGLEIPMDDLSDLNMMV